MRLGCSLRKIHILLDLKSKCTQPFTQHFYKHLNVIGREKGSVLFNDALKTFYLRFYGVRHMVKIHFDS